MGQFRLKVSVSSGMFPQEKILVLTDDRGRKHTLIVSNEQVEQDNTIPVSLLDLKDEVALIRLPGELLDTGRTVSVAQGELIPG